MVPMEIPVNRYCNCFHMITDVEKFASPYLLYQKLTLLPTNSIQSLSFYLSYLRLMSHLGIQNTWVYLEERLSVTYKKFYTFKIFVPQQLRVLDAAFRRIKQPNMETIFCRFHLTVIFFCSGFTWHNRASWPTWITWLTRKSDKINKSAAVFYCLRSYGTHE